VNYETFYSTTATVLPVLFLALTVQNTEVVRAIGGLTARTYVDFSDKEFPDGSSFLEAYDTEFNRASRRSYAAIYAVLGAMLLGVVAEAVAIWALATESDNAAFRWFLGVVTVGLALGLMATLFVRIRRENLRVLKEHLDKTRQQAPLAVEIPEVQEQPPEPT
jgi:hypothetical protein